MKFPGEVTVEDQNQATEYIGT